MQPGPSWGDPARTSPRPSSSLRQLRLLLADFDEQQLASALAFARAIAKAPEDETATQRVGAALAMLRAEVRQHPTDPEQLLVEAGAPPALPQRRAYRLRVAIEGLKPPIVRRLLVPGDLSLAGLHVALRLAMAWPTEGSYRFLVDGAPYGCGPKDEELLLAPDSTALDDLHLGLGQTWRYGAPVEGGAWALSLRVSAVLPPEACVGRPALEGGERSAPPWATAGPPGFVRYLHAYEAPGHPSHAWARSLSPQEHPVRVAWAPLRAAFESEAWARHRRPARVREADPIHALLRGH